MRHADLRRLMRAPGECASEPGHAPLALHACLNEHIPRRKWRARGRREIGFVQKMFILEDRSLSPTYEREHVEIDDRSLNVRDLMTELLTRAGEKALHQD